MNDPSSAFNAPPPRYLLESDSSDEEGQGGYPGGSASQFSRKATKTSDTSLNVRITGWTTEQAVSEAIIGVGQTGRYLFRKFDISTSTGQAQVTVEMEKRKVGDVAYKDGAVLISLEEQDGKEAWALVKGFIKAIRADRWTIVTTYLPSTYINLTSSDRSGEPPIRVLTAPNASSSTATWDAPNHLTGIAAAFLTAANHPAYPSIPRTTSALILPLPLSSLRTSNVSSALASVCPNLPFDLVKSSTAKTRWDEQDDEPFSAPGMGRRAAKWARSGNARDLQGVEGMYM